MNCSNFVSVDRNEDEGYIIMESLQKVCRILQEVRSYDQEKLELVAKIADIAGRIYELAEYEPPILRKE